MKKNSTLLLISGAFLTMLFTSCSKSYGDVNANYWLSQQRARVIFSDPSCAYMAVETSYGYSVLRLYGSYTPYEQSALYGNFENYGSGRFYDDASGSVFSAEVVEYDLTYNEALDAINYDCPNKAGKTNIADSTKNNK